MGPKITIDSATLANKGLEVIEAHFLFGLPYDRIEVVIHPTSIVHGLVRFCDGAAIAHLGNPDMRVPISYALTYPSARGDAGAAARAAGTLEFHEPDHGTFRMLPLAREAGERGGTYPCAYNAANEVAVQAFLDGRIGFLDIAAAVEDVLGRVDGSPARDLAELVEADRGARDLMAVAASLSLGVAILGLAVLILIHEAGHFVAARAVGMRPRKFYLGFGPPIVKTVRNGVEYGIAAFPLGGYVKIPGMHRPAAGDLRRTLKPEQQEQLRGPLAALDHALEVGDDGRRPGAAARELRPPLGRNRVLEELEGALAPDAYWRQGAWKRIIVIAAGPLTNIVFAVILFMGVFMVGSFRATRDDRRPCCRTAPRPRPA